MYRASRPLAVLLAATFLVAIVVNLHRFAPPHESSPLEVGLQNLAEELKKELKSYDEPKDAEAYHLLKRVPPGEHAIPVERYLKAAEHIEQMPQYSTASRAFAPPLGQLSPDTVQAMALPAWTQLGPGNIGGRTRALLIDPNNPQTMYAAGVAGGVWKSTNEGLSWDALDDLLPNLAVCSMAFDPVDSSIIYAGTGEGYSNFDSVRGAGIFKTTDAGASWDHLDSTVNSNFFFVNDIVISPNDRSRLYAATRTGVWRSSDGGASWERVLQPLSATGGLLTGGCLDLAIRTDQATDYIFVACGTFTQSTVYRNTDAAGAGAWTSVLSEPMMSRTSLALAPSDQSVVYALASGIEAGTFRDGLLAVYRSRSSGDAGTWEARVRNTSSTKLNTVLLSNPVRAFSNECNAGASSQFINQGWYDNTIAVDPADADVVWVGGVDLFRSDDGGANWGLASYWWAPPNNSAYVHADQHTIVFHPHYDGASNRVMYVGNDGGIARTTNARAPVATGSLAPCNTGNIGLRWATLNNNYGVTQFYHGLPYPNGVSYIGGTQDNGTLRGTDQRGIGNWERVFGGDGGYVAIDPTNPDNLFIETTRLSIRRSSDGGASFASAVFGITEPTNNFLFINPFVMDPGNPERLWTGGRAMWVTSSAGANWTQASAPISEGFVSAISVAPSNAARVLAGTTTGQIHRNSDALDATPTTLWPSARPRPGFVSWVAFDPVDPDVAYATYSTFGGAHVWRSTDAGATWISIDGAGDAAIPDIPVHSIVVDPINRSTLYVGTDLGVFVSLDGGATWARENTGFANVVTESLALATFENTLSLFAFTHGRGVWRVAIGPAALRITSASVSGKKLLVIGQGIASGARILVNGEAQNKTSNVERNPSFALLAKKAGKKIKRGQSAILQVQNPDGSTSPEFRFTRP